jgi:hypothetical protein
MAGKICFVFGSNRGGKHGKGAAATARDFYGAIRWRGEGIQGDGPLGTSYGIPTKDRWLRVLMLDQIKMHVDRFLNYAWANPDMTFLVTRIGCGLAGFSNEQIAPMFTQAPGNCSFDPEWAALGCLPTWTTPPHQ